MATSPSFWYIHSGAAPGPERHLSTMTPAKFDFRGAKVSSIEDAFQRAKYLFCGGGERMDLFLALPPASSGLEAKRSGGKARFASKGVTLDLSAWRGHRDNIMLEAVKARAGVDKRFRDFLVQATKEGIALLHFERSRAKRPVRGAHERKRAFRERYAAFMHWGGEFPGGRTSKSKVSDFYGRNAYGRTLAEVGRELADEEGEGKDAAGVGGAGK